MLSAFFIRHLSKIYEIHFKSISFYTATIAATFFFWKSVFCFIPMATVETRHLIHILKAQKVILKNAYSFLSLCHILLTGRQKMSSSEVPGLHVPQQQTVLFFFFFFADKTWGNKTKWKMLSSENTTLCFLRGKKLFLIFFWQKKTQVYFSFEFNFAKYRLHLLSITALPCVSLQQFQ